MSEWKPIDSYPYDKDAIFTNGKQYDIRSYSGYMVENGYCPYTHWMPLPQPPKGTDDE